MSTSSRNTSFKFRHGQQLQHVVTGKIAIVAILPDVGRLSETNAPSYSYFCSGFLYHRDQVEMEDGRFVPYEGPAQKIEHANSALESTEVAFHPV